jgi:hypothetical protein
MSRRDELFNNDAVWARFYRDGKTLGDICTEFECGVYDLSPWLTAPLVLSDHPKAEPLNARERT